MKDMLSFEKQIGSRWIAGIDEAGRGPLYGPVVVAAVILPPGFDITGIDDSKKLSEKKREFHFARITKECFFGIGIADAEEIDEINILQATKRAAHRAVEDLKSKLVIQGAEIEHLLIDAFALADCSIPQTPIIKGDALSASIAAASIVAKVTRDHLLLDAEAEHPEYGFAKHKGYGTAQHREAIRRYGPLPEHRRSFLKKVLDGNQ
ncbi:MAG: ribonuclease HII [Bacillota bacterium]|nr:ribonuclease HII [Bacillota bacterium]